MGFEIPFTGDDGEIQRCNPGRDIAYFWPQLVREAECACRRENWDKSFAEFCDLNSVTEAALLQAAACYFRFCDNAIKPELETPFAALDDAKFLQLPMPTRMAFMYRLGQMCTGAFWAGIRSTTPLGETPRILLTLLERARELTSGSE